SAQAAQADLMVAVNSTTIESFPVFAAAEALSRGVASGPRIQVVAAEMIPSLAPKVGLTERIVTAVWPQFIFSANIPTGLGKLLSQVESQIDYILDCADFDSCWSSVLSPCAL